MIHWFSERYCTKFARRIELSQLRVLFKVARLWSYWVDFLRIFEPRIMDNISQNFAILSMIVSVWSLQIYLCLYFSRKCTLPKIKASVQDISGFLCMCTYYTCMSLHVLQLWIYGNSNLYRNALGISYRKILLKC